MRFRLRNAIGLLAAGDLSALALARSGIQVIYTKIPGHPTAAVPGAVDLDGNPAATDFRALEDLIFSPDGTHWILRGRTQLGSDLESILILGSGTSGTMFAQEGQHILGGQPDERYDFFGSAIGRFDDSGNFAYSARARTGPNGSTSAPHGQRVLFWDHSSTTLRFEEGDPISGLLDQPPNPSGDEVFGNSVGSIHPLNNGTIGSQDSTILNIHTSRRPAIMYNAVSFHQTNVTTFTDLDGSTSRTWSTLNANAFYTTPDGTHWMAQGRYVGQASTDTVLVRDGTAVLKTGAPIGGSGVTVSTILAWDLKSNGDWFVRGADTTGGNYAARNGVLVAKTGDPVTRGSTETWGDTFLAFNGNQAADWVLVATTSETNLGRDTVLVRNGDTILAREGDPVELDLDANGQFDDAFIGRGNNALVAFEANDLFLSESGEAYFLANLRDAAGTDLNSNPVFGSPQAFLHVLAAFPPCTGDLNGDSVVDIADLATLLANFGTLSGGTLANGDINGDGAVDLADLTLLLSDFGRNC
jgi:hypothetical protein